MTSFAEKWGRSDEVTLDVKRIRRHEPTHARRIVPSPKIIEAGFAIAFFAGEFVGQRRGLGCSVVQVVQCVVGVDGASSFFWFKTLYLPGRRT